MDIGPLGFGVGFFKGNPMPKGLEPPLQHEFGLLLLGRNDADDAFVQALGDALVFDISDESPLVITLGQIANCI